MSADADLTEKLDAVAEHLADPTQREEIARLGMWLFLSTEILLFGGLFLGFTVYRRAYSDAFVAASRHLNVWLGVMNTIVLLTSSLTVALAVRAAEEAKARATSRWLFATCALAAAFLAIKGYEWRREYLEHLIPGVNYSQPDASSFLAGRQQLFFCFYFIMTGLHAAHMLIGTSVLGWLGLRSWRTRQAPSQTLRIRIESAGLYWHFVDVVWVFLLPLLYLTGLAGA